MSDDTGEIEPRETERPRRLRAMVILLVSIAAVATPILIARTFYNEYGISKNTLLTHVYLPGVWSALVLLVIVVIVRTRVAGDLDLVWYRWTRSEVILAIVFIFIVTVAYPSLGVVLRKVGLATRPELWFWADQRGVAFFASLTILTAIIVPIVEEIFWRGYVQKTLERIFGGLVACLVQAVPFAVYHFVPLGGLLTVSFFGLTMGAWRWRRRTLLPVILAHIVVNSLWCAVRWPGWLDCTRIRPTHDYVAEFIELSKPAGYDPNDDARDLYEQARLSAVKVPPEFDQVKDVWPTDWSAEQHAAISAWLSASEQALDFVEEGTQKPYYWPELTGNMVAASTAEFSWVRSTVFAYYTRSQLHAANRELETALSDISTCLRLADHFVGRRVLASQLVGFAIRGFGIKGLFSVLDNTDVPPAMLADLQAELEELRNSGVHSTDYAVERLIFHEAIQLMFTDDGNGDGHIPAIALRVPRAFQNVLPEFSEQQKRALRKLTRRQTTTLANRFFDLLDDAAKMTSWQFRNNTGSIRSELESIMGRNAFISEFGSVHIKPLEIAGRARTDLEALTATLAILRYEAEKGRVPPSLDALVNEGYLKLLPEDSFSDGPLVYKQTPDGFLLYSFGPDFDDDGGTPSKWGEGEQGGDQVFWPVQESGAETESAAEVRAQ